MSETNLSKSQAQLWGDDIRTERQKQNLTQKALSDLCGVKQPQIAEAEKGRLSHLESYVKIMKALGLQIHVTKTEVIENQ